MNPGGVKPLPGAGPRAPNRKDAGSLILLRLAQEGGEAGEVEILERLQGASGFLQFVDDLLGLRRRPASAQPGCEGTVAGPRRSSVDPRWDVGSGRPDSVGKSKNPWGADRFSSAVAIESVENPLFFIRGIADDAQAAARLANAARRQPRPVGLPPRSRRRPQLRRRPGRRVAARRGRAFRGGALSATRLAARPWLRHGPAARPVRPPRPFRRRRRSVPRNAGRGPRKGRRRRRARASLARQPRRAGRPARRLFRLRRLPVQHAGHGEGRGQPAPRRRPRLPRPETGRLLRAARSQPLVQRVERAGAGVAAAGCVGPPARPRRGRRPRHAGASGRGRADAPPVHARRGGASADRRRLPHSGGAAGQPAAGRAAAAAVVVRRPARLRLSSSGGTAGGRRRGRRA